jgi:hypothetical protein
MGGFQTRPSPMWPTNSIRSGAPSLFCDLDLRYSEGPDLARGVRGFLNCNFAHSLNHSLKCELRKGGEVKDQHGLAPDTDDS